MEPRSSEDPSAELERMAEEQINDLDSEGEDRTRRSKQRRERVVTLYAQGALRSAPDNYYAALIMLYGEDVGALRAGAHVREARHRCWASRAPGRSSRRPGIARCLGAAGRSASARSSSARTAAGRSARSTRA